jgi:hypothetical protein
VLCTMTSCGHAFGRVRHQDQLLVTWRAFGGVQRREKLPVCKHICRYGAHFSRELIVTSPDAHSEGYSAERSYWCANVLGGMQRSKSSLPPELRTPNPV